MIIEVNDKKYNVDVVNTSEDMKKGLQGIKEMPEDEGMLFVFDEPQTVGFWMKDTLIPLDIVFINEDLPTPASPDITIYWLLLLIKSSLNFSMSLVRGKCITKYYLFLL